MENQRKYLEWVGKDLRFHSPLDWYQIKSDDIISRNGFSLLSNYYNKSPVALVMAVLPELNLLPWLFDAVPSSYFSKLENRKRYIEWLKEKVGVDKLSELKKHHFVQNHGAGLLVKYNNSPEKVLRSIETDDSSSRSNEIESLSNIKDENILESAKGRNFWSSKANQKRFLEALGQKIGASPLTSLEPWYKVKSKDFLENGGQGIMKRYGHSIFLILSDHYPEYEWLPWKFSHSPKNLWKDETVIRKAIAFVQKELKVPYDDLHRVTNLQLRDLGVENLFLQNGGFIETLKRLS